MRSFVRIIALAASLVSLGILIYGGTHLVRLTNNSTVEAFQAESQALAYIAAGCIAMIFSLGTLYLALMFVGTNHKILCLPFLINALEQNDP